VDSSSRSVLLNMQTGETTWMDSEAVERIPEMRNR